MGWGELPRVNPGLRSLGHFGPRIGRRTDEANRQKTCPATGLEDSTREHRSTCEQNTGWKPMLDWFSRLFSALSEPSPEAIAVSPRWRRDGVNVACIGFQPVFRLPR
jgi:hypothetical protein